HLRAPFRDYRAPVHRSYVKYGTPSRRAQRSPILIRETHAQVAPLASGAQGELFDTGRRDESGKILEIRTRTRMAKETCGRVRRRRINRLVVGSNPTQAAISAPIIPPPMAFSTYPRGSLPTVP